MNTIHTCRAKSKRTGHWIYGYLIELWTEKGQEQRYAIDQCSEYDFEGNSTSVEEIDIHTLEYKTPYKACVKDDKGVTCHGHEIYEGDILRILGHDGEFAGGGKVYYNKDYGWYVGEYREHLYDWLSDWEDGEIFIVDNIMN